MSGAERSLGGIKLLSHIENRPLCSIEQECGWREYGAGRPIIEYLDNSSDVFFLTQGSARIIIYSPDGKPVSLKDIYEGATFGEFAAIDGAPRSASVEALESCVVARMAAKSFRELIHSEPAMMMELLNRSIGEIRRLTDRIYEFSALAVRHRLFAELLRLAQADKKMEGASTISPTPTHAEIASRISTHREAVSRELTRLRRLGLIEREGENLTIKDVGRLSDMVYAVKGELS